MESGHLLAIVYALSALVAAGIAALMWRLRRSTPTAVALIVAMAGLVEWCGANAAQMLDAGPWRSSWAMTAYVGVDVSVAGFLCVAVATADPQWVPRRRLVTLLAVKPLLSVLFGLTNHWHHLLHRPGTGTAGWQFGPLFWAHTAYDYLVLATAAIVLLRGWVFAARAHRRQISELIAAMIVPMAVNVLMLLGLTDSGEVDLTPIALAVSGGIGAHAVLTRGALRIAPAARELVLECLGDAVVTVAPDGRVCDLNPAAELLFRRLVPGLPADLVGTDVQPVLGRPVESFGTAGGEYRVGTGDLALDLDIRVTPLPDHRWMAGGWVVVIRDVTELSRQRRELAAVNERLREQIRDNDRLRAELAEQARRDPLTGLHNRRHLGERLQALLGGAAPDRPVGVILLDIDHFKQVNDHHGHAAGDALLVAVAAELRVGLPPGGELVRYGGEEFVVVLPGWSLPETADHAETLRARCRRVTVPGRHGEPVHRTLSAGVAAYPGCALTGDDLLATADDALYAAKESGRDRVVTSVAATPAR